MKFQDQTGSILTVDLNVLANNFYYLKAYTKIVLNNVNVFHLFFCISGPIPLGVVPIISPISP